MMRISSWKLSFDFSNDNFNPLKILQCYYTWGDGDILELK